MFSNPGLYTCNKESWVGMMLFYKKAETIRINNWAAPYIYYTAIKCDRIGCKLNMPVWIIKGNKNVIGKD